MNRASGYAEAASRMIASEPWQVLEREVHRDLSSCRIEAMSVKIAMSIVVAEDVAAWSAAPRVIRIVRAPNLNPVSGVQTDFQPFVDGHENLVARCDAAANVHTDESRWEPRASRYVNVSLTTIPSR
jgi:hypothetical protein